MSSFVIHGLVTKYYKREVYTEIKSVLTDKNYFPSITLCDFYSLTENYFAFCGHRMNENGLSEGFRKSPCNHSAIYNASALPEDYNDKTTYWTNRLFNVTFCHTWDGTNCIEEKGHFRSRPDLNHSCITWNYDGKLHDAVYSHASIKFKYNKQPNREEKGYSIIAIPHQSDITEIDLTKQVEIDPYKKYTLSIMKTLIKRQPAPYPSQCIKDGGFDILPGVYARRTCIESYKLMNTFKECGDITDYMRSHVLQYLSDEEIKRYAKTKSYDEMKRCIQDRTRRQKFNTELCPFPCKELDLATVTTFRELDKDDQHEKEDNSSLFFHLEIQLQNVDAYKIMEENPLYPWKQMACEIGGFLGLVMGASMLSLIEIIACTYFYSLKKIKA